MKNLKTYLKDHKIRVAYLIEETGYHRGHISRVFNPGYVSPMVVRSLVAKDLMEPLEKRPRVWMPTNNLQAALGKLVEHYPELHTLVEAYRVSLRTERVDKNRLTRYT